MAKKSEKKKKKKKNPEKQGSSSVLNLHKSSMAATSTVFLLDFVKFSPYIPFSIFLVYFKCLKCYFQECFCLNEVSYALSILICINLKWAPNLLVFLDLDKIFTRHIF